MKVWNVCFLLSRKNNPVAIFRYRYVLSGFLFLIFLWSVPMASLAQKKSAPAEKSSSSAKKEKPKHPPRDPKKASLMALLPGMGQAYNHKYWKIPIVYAGFGVIGYFAVNNTRYYKDFKEAYDFKVKHPDCTPANVNCADHPLAQKYSAETLKYIRDYYRRNMQLSYIIGGAWYLLQIIDANVDAHLSHWNVSNNLSLEVSPVFQPVDLPHRPAYRGLNLSLKF
jgi:hypothetical protein